MVSALKVEGRRLHELARELAAKRALAGRSSPLQEVEKRVVVLREDWAKLLGNIEPPANPVVTADGRPALQPAPRRPVRPHGIEPPAGPLITAGGRPGLQGVPASAGRVDRPARGRAGPRVDPPWPLRYPRCARRWRGPTAHTHGS